MKTVQSCKLYNENATPTRLCFAFHGFVVVGVEVEGRVDRRPRRPRQCDRIGGPRPGRPVRPTRFCAPIDVTGRDFIRIVNYCLFINKSYLLAYKKKNKKAKHERRSNGERFFGIPRSDFRVPPTSSPVRTKHSRARRPSLLISYLLFPKHSGECRARTHEY